MTTKQTDTPPALAGVSGDTPVAIWGNPSAAPGLPIETLAANGGAAECNFELLTDTDLHRRGWRAVLVGAGEMLLVTLSTGQRLKAGRGLLLGVDVCRHSGAIIWQRAEALEVGAKVLCINRQAPEYWQVAMVAHYGAATVRVQSIEPLPPGPLYSIALDNYALSDPSTACVLVGGTTLTTPHRCAGGCVPTLRAIVLGRYGQGTLRPLSDEEKAMYLH